jgi:protein SCO1
MSGRAFALVIILMAVATGGIAVVANHVTINAAQRAAEASKVSSGFIGEFELVDQDGRMVRAEDLRGKYQLVFFGFTSCPDVCPMTLTNITAALEELGPDADLVHPLLISVDPARDTPAVLKEYLGPFDPRIIGLTGSADQVAAALKSFRVYASRRELDGNDYTVDHSTFIYLMDKNGEYLSHFSASAEVEALTAGIRKAIAAS